MESNRINEAIRLHLFCNAGNISFFGIKLLILIYKLYIALLFFFIYVFIFVSLGKDTKSSFAKTFKDFRLSAGVGIVARVGNSIRFEFNLCSPIQYTPGDRIVDGFQFGVGANFI